MLVDVEPPSLILPPDLRNQFVLVTGSSNRPLADAIGAKLGYSTVHYPIDRFPDGEIDVEIGENMRRKEVFIIQSTCPGRTLVDGSYLSVNDHLKELELMIDAARRASAEKVRVVTPYFGYARQDRKDNSRKPISVADTARALEDREVFSILSVDLHSEQSQGAFRRTWDHVYGSYCLIPALQELKLDDLAVVSPDSGGTKRAEAFNNRLPHHNGATVPEEDDSSLVLIYKKRRGSSVTALAIVGDVEDKNCIVPDDVIGTGSTMIEGANILYRNGARSVWIAATHGLFLKNAAERILDSQISGVFITDTVPQLDIVLQHPEKFKVISAAHLIAGSIRCQMTGESIKDKYIIT